MAPNELVRVETNILPPGKLIVVFCGLAFALLIAFIDQNSIGIALPTIGADLNAATTISWAGTSGLIANTVFQVLYGRLSDILGRKVVFLSAIGLLALGDLLCGFAKTGPQLYAFRGLAGVGQGGITALAMIIVSDVVTLENRGKYTGILGSCVGLGNVIGPFLAAAFVEKATWRGLFWCICPIAVVSGGIVALVLPPSKVHGDRRTKVKSIDYLGIISSATAIMLLLYVYTGRPFSPGRSTLRSLLWLVMASIDPVTNYYCLRIPISGGGTYFEWNSSMVITMLTIGSVAAVIFIIVEWRFAIMPMMPLHLFKIKAICALLSQSFLFGIVYYSHLYYLPIYYQNVRGYSPLLSATMTMPFVLSQSTFSILSGQYVTRMKRYGEVIWSGFAMWTLGAGLMLLLNRETPKWQIVIFLILEGVGVGHTFQPTLVAAQAHSLKSDRAVVISVRNLLRSLGGAIGLSLSSAVFSNSLKKALNAKALNESIKANILSAILRVPDLTRLSSSEKEDVLDSYMMASKAAFTMWAPLIGSCLLLCFAIKDNGLQRAEEKQHALEPNENETGAVVEDDVEYHLQPVQPVAER